MKNSLTIFLLCMLRMVSFLTSSAQDCGVERWQVKTLSDKDTVKINFFDTVHTTVHSQKLISAPHVSYQLPRQDSEDTLYSITCYLLAYKGEADRDIHLLIKDTINNDTMVAEIPNPECASIIHTSRYATFVRLQSWFIENIGIPGDRFTYLRVPVKVIVIGVGFFDFMHGQKGMLKNGREIHPVLSMEKI